MSKKKGRILRVLVGALLDSWLYQAFASAAALVGGPVALAHARCTRHLQWLVGIQAADPARNRPPKNRARGPNAQKHQPSRHDGLKPEFLAPDCRPPAGAPSLYMGRIQPRPVLDALRNALGADRLERLESRLALRCGSVRLVLENLVDDHNGAACLRTFEGMGGQHVHAIESAENLRICNAVTKSCERWLTFHHHQSANDCLDELKAQGFTIIATHLSEGSTLLDDIDFSKYPKVACVFGNERRGVSGLVRTRADICAVLPMAGFSQSFNISAATALFLAHLRHAGKFNGDLPADELEALYLRWLIAANGKHSKDILEKAGLLDEAPFL